MNDTTVPTAQTPIVKIDAEEGRFDMNAMKEFSLQESDKEEQLIKKDDSNGKESSKESDEEGSEESTEEESSEESSEESDVLEDESDESDEDESDESEEEEVSGKFIVAKAGDKSIKIPKDAKFTVKIDGKSEELTAQECINRASGAINIERETSKLGRERKIITEEKTKWRGEVAKYQENLSFLTKLTEEGTLEDVCEFFGSISGKEPTKVIEDLMTRVHNYVEQFSQMTEREKQLYNENRRYKFRQSLEESSRNQAATKTAQEAEIAEVRKELANIGLTDEDWISAAEEIQQKLKDGELDSEMDAFEIIDYAAKKKAESNVVTAISSVNTEFAKDQTFVKKMLKAVTTAEQLSGEKFSPKELRELVKSAVQQKKNGLSESLSRKVAKAEKSGKTSSKSATSRKQGNSGPATLNEHRQLMASKFESEWGYDE